jgi:tetratricopeptide (TPR) repeat protein
MIVKTLKKTLIAVVACWITLGATAQELQTDTLVIDPDQRYDVFFLEAMVQRQKGNQDAAFDLLRHCLEIRPDASEAYFFLAQYYNALKDYDKALAYFQRAVSIDGQNPVYLETLAQAYIGQGDYEQAAGTFEMLVAQDKNREDVLETLLQLNVQLKRYDKAIDVLDRLEQLNGKGARLSVTKSEIYNSMGNQEAAIAELKALADSYPFDLNYRAEYANMLLQGKQQKKGVSLLEDILVEEPDNLRAQVALYDHFSEAGNEAVADSLFECMLLNRNASQDTRIQLFRQQIQKSEMAGGDSTRVLELFGKVLAQPQTDADIAILCATYMDLKKMPRDTVSAMLQHILTIAPDNAAARLQLVSYAWNADDRDRVIELCQTARQYNPDEMAFYYYQGMAYYQKGEKDQALSAFQNGIGVINEQSNPAIVSDFYAIMGDLLHEKGLIRQAYEAYDSCLQWKDDNLGCLNNYAYFLSEQGQQLEKAEQMSHRTVKAEPKNATYLDTYAWILFMQQRYAEARIYIDQALQNDSDSSAVIIEHAGDIYALCGNKERAVELWKEACQRSTAEDKRVLIRKIKLHKYLKE